MCDQQSLRSACAYAQSDQSLCLSLAYSKTIKILTEHHLEFLSLKGATQARPNLHLSKCHIVTVQMSMMIGMPSGFSLNLKKITFFCSDWFEYEYLLYDLQGIQ